LVLVFVVYNRRREAEIKYPGPDDDVRENIINYDDEGGGEDDMTAFDITPLQIPIGAPGHEMMIGKMPCKYGSLALIAIIQGPSPGHPLTFDFECECLFRHDEDASPRDDDGG
jgi:hypothetical protein